jgi:hypothetical protein
MPPISLHCSPSLSVPVHIPDTPAASRHSPLLFRSDCNNRHWLVRLVAYQQVESARENFTPKLLTEPYVTVSRHTALHYTFDARNNSQCANNLGFAFLSLLRRLSASFVDIRYLLHAHLSNLDWKTLQIR